MSTTNQAMPGQRGSAASYTVAQSVPEQEADPYFLPVLGSLPVTSGHVSTDRALRPGVLPNWVPTLTLSLLLALASQDGAAQTTPPPSHCGNLLVPGGEPTCGTAVGGASQSSVASLNTNATSVAGGNPINLATGNKHQREEDMPALPGVLGLELIRHHNSAYASSQHHGSTLGQGWTPARVKVVVASVTQLSAEYVERWQPC